MGSEVLRADVVIVGGGVSGLFMLDQLRTAGYSVLLLERHQLGSGQTGHSHVYLHEGHLYRAAGEGPLIADLQRAQALWRLWLADHPVPAPAHSWADETGAYVYGFISEIEAANAETLWSEFGLPCSPVGPPVGLEGTEMRAFRKVTAQCLNSTWLVSELSANYVGSLLQVDTIEDVSSDETGHRLNITSPNGPPLRIECNCMVLAAGTSNSDLLQQLGMADVLQTRTRSAHMLVVQGSRENLQPVTGVFGAPLYLFIVSKPGSNGEVIWLISDDSAEEDTQRWKHQVLAKLRRFAPRLHEVRDVLAWGSYKAPKAELVLTDEADRTVRSGRLVELNPNLWAVWPTKLTLAPLFAAELVQLLQDRFGPTISQPDVRTVAAPPGTAPERWQLIELEPWSVFSAGVAGQ